MKQFLKASAALSALMVAACSDAGDSNTAGNDTTTVAAVDVAPELGTWGVDMTAAKPSVKWGDDFYAAANGSWLDTYEIPADRTGLRRIQRAGRPFAGPDQRTY